MTLTELLTEYEKEIEEIHDNRKAIRGAVTKNQKSRQRINELKKKIVACVEAKLRKGQTLSEICTEEFGIVDRRFHVLFSFFRKE
jgi:Mg2+ and Co2+ transporter CorA